MKRSVPFLAIFAFFACLVLAVAARSAEPEAVTPFETRGEFVVRNVVDATVRAAHKKHRIEPANPCSDAVFLRRVYLDTTGALPEASDVVAFLRNTAADKRSVVIDDLLSREEFADYQALLWCDALRVKAEFPINLWPNAVQCYHRWIRDAVRENMPYDRFARALLTSSGSNFRVAPVNFYRAVQSRDPKGLAQTVALSFMGARAEAWPEERLAGLAAFFSRVAYKGTAEWKEEIVFTSPSDGLPIEAVFPDGRPVTVPADRDPREVFADWLISPGNPWFARCVVNRIWHRLMGRGIVHEPDDFRPDNPPSNPELLDALAKELVLSRWDLDHVYRLILGSSTYQQSSVPRSKRPEAEAQFAHYVVRPLGAEVLMDALCRITGTGETYMSAIPEPFTNVPAERRSVQLADGSTTSPFLEMFGRPARDTGLVSERNEGATDGQRLHLLNSTNVRQRIERGPELRKLFLRSRGNPEEVLRGIYLAVLSRPPTPGELAAIERYSKTPGLKPQDVGFDLVWALLNTKEFLYRH